METLQHQSLIVSIIWEEGKGPEVVFAVSSKATHRDDLAKKMRLYAKCDLKTGERLLSDEEALLKAKAENAQLLEEIERLRRQLAEK